MNQPKNNPTSVSALRGVINVFHGERQTNFNRVEAVLQRLEGVKIEGKGYRALCPACGGKARKLAIAAGDDGRTLIHCFGCNDTRAVLNAIGLRWADIYPFRAWPNNPEEKRKALHLMREVGWRSALGVLDNETVIVCIAYGQIMDGNLLSIEDHNRLLLAGKRIASAWGILH